MAKSDRYDTNVNLVCCSYSHIHCNINFEFSLHQQLSTLSYVLADNCIQFKTHIRPKLTYSSFGLQIVSIFKKTIRPSNQNLKRVKVKDKGIRVAESESG